MVSVVMPFGPFVPYGHELLLDLSKLGTHSLATGFLPSTKPEPLRRVAQKCVNPGNRTTPACRDPEHVGSQLRIGQTQ